MPDICMLILDVKFVKTYHNHPLLVSRSCTWAENMHTPLNYREHPFESGMTHTFPIAKAEKYFLTHLTLLCLRNNAELTFGVLPGKIVVFLKM